MTHVTRGEMWAAPFLDILSRQFISRKKWGDLLFSPFFYVLAARARSTSFLFLDGNRRRRQASWYVHPGEDGTYTSLVQKTHAPDPVLGAEKLYAK